METANSAIKAALEQLPELPTPVVDWLVETGTDSDDEFRCLGLGHPGKTTEWTWIPGSGFRDIVLDFIPRGS